MMISFSDDAAIRSALLGNTNWISVVSVESNAGRRSYESERPLVEREGRCSPVDDTKPNANALAVFCSQINGQEIPHSPSFRYASSPESSNDPKHNMSELEDAIDDLGPCNRPCSFSPQRLGLPLSKYAKTMTTTPTKKSKRWNDRKKTQQPTHVPVVTSDEEPPHRSLEGMKSFILQNLSGEVRDQISDEVWEGIVEGVLLDDVSRGAASEAFEVLNMSSQLQADQIQEDLDGESSAVSEISVDVSRGARHKGGLRSLIAARKASRDRWEAIDASDRSAEFSDGTLSFHSVLPSQQISTASTNHKGVSFGLVQVRFYERVLDVHPSVSSGAAIGIGWDYERGKLISVDDWESKKSGLVRSKIDMILPRHIREAMLKDAGYNQKDISQAARVTRETQNHRKNTIASLKAQRRAEAANRATSCSEYDRCDSTTTRTRGNVKRCRIQPEGNHSSHKGDAEPPQEYHRESESPTSCRSGLQGNQPIPKRPEPCPKVSRGVVKLKLPARGRAG